MILTEDLVQKLKSLERLIGSNMANTARMNRLEELGRVDSEKAFTKKGKKNLKDEKKRIVRELNKKKDGGSLKPVDKEKNPGLAKLPTQVRNKMAKLCPRGKAAAKRKFKVYPSAYANMYASAVCSGKVTPGGKKKRKKMREGGMVIEDMTTMIEV